MLRGVDQASTMESPMRTVMLKSCEVAPGRRYNMVPCDIGTCSDVRSPCEDVPFTCWTWAGARRGSFDACARTRAVIELDVVRAVQNHIP